MMGTTFFTGKLVSAYCRAEVVNKRILVKDYRACSKTVKKYGKSPIVPRPITNLNIEKEYYECSECHKLCDID
jgi:nitrate reductase cytochrome c-type subunit